MDSKHPYLPKAGTRPAIWKELVSHVKNKVNKVASILTTATESPLSTQLAAAARQQLGDLYTAVEKLDTALEKDLASDNPTIQYHPHTKGEKASWRCFIHEIKSGVAGLSTAFSFAESDKLTHAILQGITSKATELISIMDGMSMAFKNGDPTWFNYNKVVIEVIPWMTSYLENFKATFDIKDKEICIIINQNMLLEIETTRLQQILNNLLTNAIKYSNSGKEITIELAWADAIKIEVTNSGTIPVEQQNDIFLPDLSSSKPVDSRGLGLFLCKRLVQAWKGKIGVSCTENTTTFSVEWPLQKKDSSAENQ